ncbi:unnamed protein product [Lymnaea stagnalis]|uniref:Reverse transcriptase RNase H-like domain-containing protein n=1 Tax=Lymnaea stagnalis TaxID=6523 RepID=A0AAV2H081_LYMST
MEGVYLTNYIFQTHLKSTSCFLVKRIFHSWNFNPTEAHRHRYLRTQPHAGRKCRPFISILHKKQYLNHSTRRKKVQSTLFMKNGAANTHDGAAGQNWLESCYVDQAKPPVLPVKNKKARNLLLMIKRGPVMNSMLHKMHINLKEKNLMQHNEILREKTLSLDNVVIRSPYCEEAVQPDFSRLSPKELFYHKLISKYQYPSTVEVEKLMSNYPDHMKLFFDVVKPLVEADPAIKLDLVVTSHFNNNYFKAHLCFQWQHKIQETGIHSDKQQAIERVFLRMCFQLEVHGLIYKNSEGIWKATTCEKVMNMLETMAKYGASTFGSSRGRGFKIILEQAKLTGSSMDEAVKVENMETLTKENSAADILKSVGSNQECFNQSNKSYINVQFKYSKDSIPKKRLAINNEIFGLVHHFYENYSKTNNDISNFISANLLSNINSQLDLLSNSDNILVNKPFWVCTVHVGWPSPFTVQKQGISLPSAYMLGFMAVASKLKTIGLLTKDNTDVSSTSLMKHMFMYTKQHWIVNHQLACDKTAIVKFNANAELFCDASTKGFGAYLLLEGERQVYWLSEEWEEIRQLTQLSTHKFDIPPTLAELYAVVNAIFSWKRKLRGRRLLCISDNKTVVGLINSFNTNPVEVSSCICKADHLISILHSSCQQFGITLHASWISREQNWLADSLSRQDLNTFHMYVPHARPKRTKSVKIKLKEQIVNVAQN